MRMEIQNLYSQFQPLLFSIAYRMLGTVSEAEDIVHDVYLQVSEKTLNHVENKKAYLCRMVTNKCIDYVKSAAHQREVYTGPWLPEPLILNDDDPALHVIKGEDVSFAFLLLLQKLNPVERAVFILREVLDYEYVAISHMLKRSEPTCRKIYSRVKKKFPIHQEELEGTKTQANNEVIQNFVFALHQGNIERIEELLNQDVTLYSDGGGKVYAALKPINTRNLVVRFLTNILAQNQHAEEIKVQFSNVNGELGLIIEGADHIKTVFSFQVHNNQIQDIYIVRNPDKLKHVTFK
ncbi:RNA polymerase sigma-70 factor [Bacillus sp. BGMRC 2118]|nr:RNA polymerase sigma-70 factor [Bacillus sp. BGMRC 2118]